jgi:hypothetical protein
MRVLCVVAHISTFAIAIVCGPDWDIIIIVPPTPMPMMDMMASGLWISMRHVRHPMRHMLALSILCSTSPAITKINAVRKQGKQPCARAGARSATPYVCHTTKHIYI